MRILLTFTGFHDPYSPSVVDGCLQAGPILSMLENRSVDTVILFGTPGTVKQTEETCVAIENNFSDITVEIVSFDELYDPTDHIRILNALRTFMGNAIHKYPDAEFSISIASGTPSMHACWLLLVADGSLPASILYGHPPRSPVEPYRVTEVDLAAPEFPEITPRETSSSVRSEALSLDLSALCEELKIIGDDKLFLDALDRSVRLAEYNCHILIVGETGVGKEHVARLIHKVSGREQKKFIAVNCAALPKELAESILFGHEKGAFTGALQRQEGEFSRANGGTLFLDEIGDMPLEIQAKILRVMQEGVFKPLGGEDREVDVRVVAATNVDLAKALRNGTFRTDLAQRFVDTIELPPLRRRRGDIIKLATFALMRWNHEYGNNRKINRRALQKMQAYTWPGNVRELVSSVERAAMLSKTNIIEPDDLRLGEASWFTGSENSSLPEPHEGFSLKVYQNEVRERMYRRALEIASGSYAEAARYLGVSTQAVHKFIQKSDLTCN